MNIHLKNVQKVVQHSVAYSPGGSNWSLVEAFTVCSVDSFIIMSAAATTSNPREQAINSYIAKVKEHREYEARCKKRNRGEKEGIG